MPDNVFPTASPVDDAVIALLDRLRPGEWLALASDTMPLPDAAPSLRVDAPLEHIAGPVLALLPISRHTPEPLLWWAAVRDDDIVDLTYAVQGLASDGAGRWMPMTAIDDDLLMSAAADAVAAAIRVPWDGAPFVFLVCVGGGAHTPTGLTSRPALADVC